MPRTRAVLGLLTAASCAIAAPAAYGADILTDPRLRLEGARYVPNDAELVWSGWIGGGIGLLRSGGVTFDFVYEMETVLGDVVRPFEATQANYHLELALRKRAGEWEAGPFFHHVSRHAVDRIRPGSVDWNMLGFRLAGPLGERASFVASAGLTTRDSVGYDWELVAGVDGDLGRIAGTDTYFHGELRLVGAKPSGAFPALDRGDFVDVRLEVGPRWQRGDRSLVLFLAYERRNDVFLDRARLLNRALLGFRILLDGRSAR